MDLRMLLISFRLKTIHSPFHPLHFHVHTTVRVARALALESDLVTHSASLRVSSSADWPSRQARLTHVMSSC
jgi:hypothetical protein